MVIDHKKVLDYFRTNIFESIAAYTAWKAIHYARSIAIVNEKNANRYVEIQNYHPEFFVLTERAYLVNFVILSTHPFDRRRDSYSLKKVDDKACERFISENKNIISHLKKLRDEVFAHRKINLSDLADSGLKVPPMTDLDAYYENLIKFYNELTVQADDSSTAFDGAREIKRHIELMYMNLYRGNPVRLREVEIEWQWKKDQQIISKAI